MTKFDQLKAEREKRIKGYIKQGLTAQEIGDREGLELDYALKMRKKLGGKEEAKAPKDDKTYGLTDATYRFRVALGDQLAGHKTSNRLHHLEVARDTGITMRQQTQATVNSDKNSYNWKLSQIERMAKMLGVDVTRLLVEALSEPLKTMAAKDKTTVGAMVDRWIKEKDDRYGFARRG